MGTFFVLSFSSFFTQQRRLFDVSLSLICNEDLYARTGRKSNFSFCFEHPSICSCRVRQLRCWHRFSVKQAAKLLHFAGSVKRWNVVSNAKHVMSNFYTVLGSLCSFSLSCKDLTCEDTAFLCRILIKSLDEFCLRLSLVIIFLRITSTSVIPFFFIFFCLFFPRNGKKGWRRKREGKAGSYKPWNDGLLSAQRWHVVSKKER